MYIIEIKLSSTKYKFSINGPIKVATKNNGKIEIIKFSLYFLGNNLNII